MLKRAFDIVASLVGLVILSPFFVLIAIAVKLNSRGPVFFRQVRVGRHGKQFRIYKFRTMVSGAEKSGRITVGKRDRRVTAIGQFLRHYKIDEFPQLINILKGEMSVVGPRPEVPEYVAMYNEDQRKVLSVRPGLTDYASIKFSGESELLEGVDDPMNVYIHEIMPEKLQLNLQYMKDRGFFTDLKIIGKTVLKILN